MATRNVISSVPRHVSRHEARALSSPVGFTALPGPRRRRLQRFAITRNGEEEHGAFARLRFGPDPAAVPVKDALDSGQAHSGALELLRAMKPLKNAEKLARVLEVEAGSVVANENDTLPGPRGLSHLNTRLFAAPCV